MVAGLCLAAGCRDAEPVQKAPRDDEAEYVEGPSEAVLTSAESAAAMEKIRAHADSVTRAVRGPAPGGEPLVPAPPHVETPAKAYASCLAQARGLEEPAKLTILQACERLRQQPAQTPG